MKELTGASILVVDDDHDHLIQLRRMLSKAGCNSIYCTPDPFEGIQMYRDLHPDMMLLDYRLPPVDGFHVLDQIWHGEAPQDALPVIMITSGADEAVRLKALELGVSDFIPHPSDYIELLLRVRNVLRIYGLNRQLQDQVGRLDDLVRSRTEQLEDAYIEVFERLVVASEFRDDGTGEHARRVGIVSEGIGLQLGMPVEECIFLRSAARLHDLGKLGVPDAVLFKPGPLNDQELEIVRAHPGIGGTVLDGCRHPLLIMAKEIATTHHERWDGKGYPSGLSGQSIPISGRIVAVADAYDVMTSDRAYRSAETHAFAVQEIMKASGTQFDPHVVDAFVARYAPSQIAPKVRQSVA